ncbi:unnamed protein product [Ilex paraguariensis]|uniref:Uncharacterized protein n=1 Tax=Ilex paraguariensis TaxID=185542 RepID=A0ABC8RIX7_9AQUA
MENGEHSGKNIVDQNGENILQTESAQRRDTEDLLVTNPDLVLEVNDDAEQVTNEVSKFSRQDNMNEAQDMQGGGFNGHDMQDPTVMQEGGDSDKGAHNLSLNDATTCDTPSYQNNVANPLDQNNDASPPDQNNDAETMIKSVYDFAAYKLNEDFRIRAVSLSNPSNSRASSIRFEMLSPD